MEILKPIDLFKLFLQLTYILKNSSLGYSYDFLTNQALTVLVLEGFVGYPINDPCHSILDW